MSDPNFAGPEGRLAHLGIMTEDLEAALAEAAAWGVSELPQGRNWLALLTIPAMALGIGCALPLYLFFRSRRIV